MISYESKECPLRFGIMYAEDAGAIAQTAWYESDSERNEAVERLLETGELDLIPVSSPIGRTVEVYAFSTVDAGAEYYVTPFVFRGVR